MAARPLREQIQPLFGRHDVSSVRAGPAAARGAEAMRAEAFATGPHVVFGEGKYQPGTAAGSHLLAHELAHVVQQGARGDASVDKHNAADPRLPADQAERSRSRARPRRRSPPP